MGREAVWLRTSVKLERLVEQDPQGPCSRDKDSALVRYIPVIKSLL